MFTSSNLQLGQDGLAHRRLAFLSLAGGGVFADIVLRTAGLEITVLPLLGYGIILCLLFAAHAVYRRRPLDEPLSLMAGGLAMMITGALFAGIIANAALRLRVPFIDSHLAAADQALGIDTPALVVWTARSPIWSWLLGLAYSSIFPIAFVAVIWLGFRREARRLWELVAGFAVGIQLAAVISIFLPALGNIVHAGLGGLAGRGLPEGAGIYHLHAIAEYRDGSAAVLDVRKLEGVVTFPSFHMMMAIVVAYAFRQKGLAGHLMAAWCLLVAISTVPIGGHYVVDLAAGVVLWVAIMALTRLPALGQPTSGARWQASTAPETAA